MYDQTRDDILFIMLFTGVTALAMMASCYLLFRRGNAFAPDITTPTRLRRWVAVFFAFMAFNHLWYMPIFFLTSSEDIRLCDFVGGLLDFMTVFPLAIVVLLVMLQDRRRPLWPVAVMMAPFVIVGAFSIAIHNYDPLPMIYVYFVLMCIGLIIYMIRALRQYGRWLRDNFADLEHKEVWQSVVVLAIILLLFGIYGFTSEGPAYLYATQIASVILIYYLLWRVETLSDLSIPHPMPLVTATHDNIGLLLQQHCIDTQLYLQHDLTLVQLAKTIGTNRYYLSRYFASQGVNYNAYINNLRVSHFVSLYREAVAAQHSFTAKQLSLESGFRSYSTFSDAFKRKMGQSVADWTKTANEREQASPKGT